MSDQVLPTPPCWRPAPGWSGLYEVSDQGEVWSWRSRRALTPLPVAGTHVQVVLKCAPRVEHWLIHRLVLWTFVGPCPPGLEGCHENGVGTDNALSNLRWDTHASNVNDAIRHGTWVGFEQAEACSRGHELVAPNIVMSEGRRRCRACRATRAKMSIDDPRFQAAADERYRRYLYGESLRSDPPAPPDAVPIAALMG